jgi:hypothetical protein
MPDSLRSFDVAGHRTGRRGRALSDENVVRGAAADEGGRTMRGVLRTGMLRAAAGVLLVAVVGVAPVAAREPARQASFGATRRSISTT